MTRLALLALAAAAAAAVFISRASPATFDWNAAYQAAKPGDTIQVPAGTYGAVVLKWNPNLTGANCDGYAQPAVTSGCVTFTPAAGAVINWSVNGGPEIDGNGVRLLGFDFTNANTDSAGNRRDSVAVNNGGCTGHTPTGIIFQNDRGGEIYIDGPASHIADVSGDWSSGDATVTTNGDAVRLYPCVGGTGPDHVLLQGNYHDTLQTQAGQHLACLHVTDATYLTITKSRVANCAQHDLEIEDTFITGTGDVIDSSTFEPTCERQGSVCGSVNAIDVGLGYQCGSATQTNLTIENNVIDSLGFNCGTTTSAGLLVKGNTLSTGYDSYHCSVYQSWGVQFVSNSFPNGGVCGTQGPPPPPPGSGEPDGDEYAPACAPTCDQQITSMKAQVAQALTDAKKVVSDLGG